jgi:hypothetical protein
VVARSLEHFDRYWILNDGTPKKGIESKDLTTGLEYTEQDLLFHAGDRVVPLLALSLCAQSAAQQLDREWQGQF